MRRAVVPAVTITDTSCWTISPSLHAVVEDRVIGASVSKGALPLALVEVAVTTFVNLTLGGVAQYGGR